MEAIGCSGGDAIGCGVGFGLFFVFALWVMGQYHREAVSRATKATEKLQEDNYREAYEIVESVKAHGISPEVLRDMEAYLRLGTGPKLDSSHLSRLKQTLFEHIRDLVVFKHSTVLTRKRDRTIFHDEYGHEVRDTWEREKAYFCEKVLVVEMWAIARHFLGDRASTCWNWALLTAEAQPGSLRYEDLWSEAIEAILDEVQHSTISDQVLEPDADGLAYEAYVAHLVSELGWSAELTKSTGDHGADVIASRNGLRVAIQCKHYAGKVGNKAVQEVFSAARFYDCDVGVVISNSEFTSAARQAAQKLGILLVHHDEMQSTLESLGSEHDQHSHEAPKTREGES